MNSGLITTLLPKLRSIATHPGIFQVRISLYTTDSNASKSGINLTFMKDLGTEDPVHGSVQITKPVRAAISVPPHPVRSQPIRGRPRGDSDATLVAAPEQPDFALEQGRPNIRTLVEEKVKVVKGRLGIAGKFHRLSPWIHADGGRIACGPVGLMADISNVAAQCQMGILRGEGQVTEIALHTEVFGW
jgi:hypothetical protein